MAFTKEELAKGKVDYNYGMNKFPSEEAPGISVFYKDENGDIFHTYSACARGTETTMSTYNYLERRHSANLQIREIAHIHDRVAEARQARNSPFRSLATI